MAVVVNLFVEDLSYKDLMDEYRRLSVDKKREILEKNGSFIDWLVDPNVNSLTLAQTQEFRRILQSVLKQKLEILLTAVGSVKVDESPSRLLRSDDFVSVRFLKGLFLTENAFEVFHKEGTEYVRSCAKFSGDPEIKTTVLSSVRVKAEKKNLAKFSESDMPSNKVIKNDITLTDASEKLEMKQPVQKQVAQSDDPRAKQLQFLFRCQPDVIAALQPTLCLNDLFKAYSFWKSYCTHTQTTLVAWLLDLAEYKYSSGPSNQFFSSYEASLKNIFAKEIKLYVCNKSKSIKELVSLISQCQSGLVDENFLQKVVDEDQGICEADSQSSLSFPLYTTSSRKEQLAKLDANKVINTTEAKTSVNQNNLTVIDASFYLTWEIRGVFVPKDIRAKILPLLTINVEWSFISCVLKKISHEREKFIGELISNFDSFFEFLIEFGEKFKPSLNNNDYSNHLKVVLNQQIEVRLNLSAEKCIKLNDLFYSLQCESCNLNLVHRSFLLKALEFLPHKFHRLGDVVCHFTVSSVSLPNETAAYLTLDELKNLPQIQKFLATDFQFSDFVGAFQHLSDNIKQSIKAQSLSFYSLLLEAANMSTTRRGFTKDYLRQMIVTATEKLFQSLFVTSLSLMDIEVRFSCDDFSMIHCPDIKDAIENVAICATNLKLDGSWVHYSKTMNPGFGSVVADRCRLSSHMSLIHSPSSTVQMYIHEIGASLYCDEPYSRRLGKLLFHVIHMPYPVKIKMEELQISPFHFIVDSFPNQEVFLAILKQEICMFLGNSTMFCRDFLQEFFRHVPDFMYMNEFLDLLNIYKDTFVVVGHHQVGNIMCLVRQPNADGKIMFFDRFEEEMFATVLQLFRNLESGVNVSYFCDALHKSTELSPAQKDFVFGLQTTTHVVDYDENRILLETLFKRYLLMHPSAFVLQHNLVSLCSSTCDLPPQRIMNSKKHNNPVYEEGQIITSEDESSKYHFQSSETRKRKASQESSQSKKKKRKKKKHTSKLLLRKETLDSDVKSLEDLISSLPNHLIQDVAVGRLMSTNHEMKVMDLVDTLGASLLRDKKQFIWNNVEVLNKFKAKVLCVLKNGTQFRLTTDGDQDIEQSVSLLLNAASVTDPMIPCPTTAVFGEASSLTGVSQKKLTAYIKKVLEINSKPLSLGVIFAMVRQKYALKKSINSTPDEVLHCQTIACMKNDPEVFINCVRKTCSLKAWVSVEDKAEGLDNVTKDLSEDVIRNSVMNCLQDNDAKSGLTVDELTAKVLKSIEAKFPPSCLRSLRIIIQALAAEGKHFGFSANGNLLHIAKNDFPNVREENPKSSSDEEMKLVVEEEEEIFVLPDSTENNLIVTDEPDHGKSSADEVKESAEEDVIRCSFDSYSNELVTADSTTSLSQDEPSTSKQSDLKLLKSPPRDPRLKGKVFQKIQASTNNANKALDTLSNFSVASTTPSSFTLSSAKMRPHHFERYKKIQAFATEFLEKNGNSCEAQVLFDQAYLQFRNERFARSMLACEAYVRDFIATTEDNCFSFGNQFGDVGVTWVFYSPLRFKRFNRTETSIPCAELLPEVLDVVYTFVNSKLQKKAPLQAVCERVANCFSRSFETFNAQEVLPVCKNLVLIACIRNLRWFFFGKVEPIVYVRQTLEHSSPSLASSQKHFRVSVTLATGPGQGIDHSSDITPTFFTSSDVTTATSIKQKQSKMSGTAAKNTVAALKRMGEILRQHGPIKKTVLKDLWLKNSNSNHQKVFGTGVSFSLQLRKFEAYFPTSSSGKVYVDEIAFENYLEENP